MSSIWKPHLTVAAVVEQDGRYLMVEERQNGEPVFNQPAGHVEDGEAIADAAIRETLEESAYPFTPQSVIGIYRWVHPEKQRTYLRIAFAGTVGERDMERELDTEIITTHWLSREQLLAQPDKLRSPLVMRCIDDYLAGKRYPLDMLVDL